MEHLRQEHDTAEKSESELQRQLSHLGKALTYQGRIEQISQRLINKKINPVEERRFNAIRHRAEVRSWPH